MKKEVYRDYATAAYIFWAHKGYITGDEFIEKVKQKAIRESKNEEPADANRYIRACVTNHLASKKDIEACCKAFSLFEESGKEYICDAVRSVYGIYPVFTIRRGDITARVRAYAHSANTDERNVYRWLEQARKTFAAMRGLRFDDEVE